YSGRFLEFNDKTVVDKHSTGGIGDKASFVLAPIAACLGVKVPMIAGRGLGHTGGTVDKIECIRGFKTNLSLDEFAKQLKEKGLVLMGQTPEIAPADRLIYALRDVTATIDCIPLITASIMSKKLAEGAEGIVFDIKHGSGAFMRDKKDARTLAKSLLATGKRFKRKGVALLTDMGQPLGNEVGHILEIQESIATLKGEGPKDLTEISVELAAHMAVLAGVIKSLPEARKKAQATLHDGSALKKFAQLIKWQGGDEDVVYHPQKLAVASEKLVIRAPKNGWIKSFENDQIGYLLIELGGGRKTKEDVIDMAVGFTMHAKVGTKLKKGDPIMTIHHHAHQKGIAEEISKKFIKDVMRLSASSIRAPKLITEVIKA
ncbi:MAG: thymidine phosphorylase, partial [Bacteriovoracaceae bacterium]|nr:thymidine phosphorylase [Bacteriovoracaceae bacterium]